MLDLRGHLDHDAVRAAIAWATERYHACDVCAARCGVDRHAGELGDCKLGAEARVYKEYLHFGEERCLVPTHAVYLTGCNFRCAFCSDDRFVRSPEAHGVVVPPAALARRIAQRRAEGATSVSFIGGLPDVNVLFILQVLERCPPDTHVVWNTNLWTTGEVVDRLEGVVGTWLIDLKFGSDRCARKLAGVQGYRDRLTRLTARVATRHQALIRHLLMPGHLDCCTRPCLTWLAAHHPDVPINVMTGYMPYRMARGSTPMAGAVPEAERAEAVALARALPFTRLLVDGVE